MPVFIQYKNTYCGRAITFAIRMQFFVATLALITLAVAVRGEQAESDGQAQRDYVSIPTKSEKKKSLMKFLLVSTMNYYLLCSILKELRLPNLNQRNMLS